MGFPRVAILGVAPVLVAIALGVARYSVVKTKRTILPAGREFSIPMHGTVHSGEFTETAADNGGERVVIRAYFPAGLPGIIPGKSASPPLHVHLKQAECFTVLKGTMGYLLNGTEGVHRPGEGHKCLPPGLSHVWYNAANETDLEMSVVIKPALNAEEFFRTLEGLTVDFAERGGPGLLQVLVTFVRGQVRLCDFSETAWAVITHAVVPFAETVLGYKAFPPEYTHMIDRKG